MTIKFEYCFFSICCDSHKSSSSVPCLLKSVRKTYCLILTSLQMLKVFNFLLIFFTASLNIWLKKYIMFFDLCMRNHIWIFEIILKLKIKGHYIAFKHFPFISYALGGLKDKCQFFCHREVKTVKTRKKMHESKNVPKSTMIWLILWLSIENYLLIYWSTNQWISRPTACLVS